ncbi:TetR/AcrR family transcriptional regulator [Lipingzhangella sp. LS1_29]|uniref:TetR/AcrR family transcriptional regulator n=1 Tax=Lipingzhangella rawalii TaxID=2055835 RepID=A0ABU2H2I9_9ACTN|nr:TetR/AcrR family transcriptional regulator [Lipingzhangella rawalii]MDS1269519.1 TetR/AcrR family transcriptional regulator [Lipingzhangella rawalii]
MAQHAAPKRRPARDTRNQLVEAAGTVLREQGYARASARSIATTAGVNSALVFYHFGSVDQLLLAALDRSSEQRMAAHRARAAQAHTLEDLVEVAVDIYRADAAGGHLTLFAELVAASVSKPELRPEISRRAQPWMDFVAAEWERVLGGSPLGRLLPAPDVANAAITLYLGINLFSVLDEDQQRTEAVFDLARELAPRAKLLTLRLPGRKGTRTATEHTESTAPAQED